MYWKLYIDKKIKELMKVCETMELKSPTDNQCKKIVDITLPKVEESIEKIY